MDGKELYSTIKCGKSTSTTLYSENLQQQESTKTSFWGLFLVPFDDIEEVGFCGTH